MTVEQASDGDLLRGAWESTTGNSAVNALLRRSLKASAASVPSLSTTLRELTGEDARTELDLHLDGAGVKEHETNALRFGRFVTRFARSVKEVAKEIGGLAKLPTDLQILAPSAGSVRVVLRSPERHRGPDALPHTASETLEAMAMRRIVSIVLQAEEEEDSIDSPLIASVHELKGAARSSIDLLARSVIEGGWQLAGELREPSRGVTTVRLSEQGAARLANAARQREVVEERDVPIVGHVDSWAWSTATMGFSPDDGRRLFSASVPEHLERRVAHLLEGRSRVLAKFLILIVYPQGDESSPRHSYSLTAIDELPEPERLPFE